MKKTLIAIFVAALGFVLSGCLVINVSKTETSQPTPTTNSVNQVAH